MGKRKYNIVSLRPSVFLFVSVDTIKVLGFGSIRV